jgi:hypothetical protein
VGVLVRIDADATMTPPPAPALVIAGGIGWNLARSRRNRRVERTERKRTISRWVCGNKKAAVTLAVGAGTWCAVHWALYVIEEWT